MNRLFSLFSFIVSFHLRLFSGLFCFWKNHLKCASFSFFAFDGYFPVHEYKDAFYKCKPQPVSFFGMGCVSLIKFIENVAHTFPAHATSGVADFYFHHFVPCFLPDHHASSRLCKFDCFGYQVVPDELHQARICLYQYAFLHIYFQLQIFPVPQRIKKLNGLLR